jgi:hypothetical protein
MRRMIESPHRIESNPPLFAIEHLACLVPIHRVCYISIEVLTFGVHDEP